MLQVAINGIAVGLGISTLALGFQLVYRPTGVFHIAAGAIYALVPFIYAEMIGRGVTIWVALAASVGAGLLVSCVVELLNHRRLGTGQACLNAHLLSSLGLYIVLSQLVIICWGPNVRSLRTEQDIAFSLGLLTITRAQIYSLTIQPALLLMFGLLLAFTTIGLKLRGLMQNPTEMAILGHSTLSFRLLAFALSGFFVSAASLVNAYDLGFAPRGGLSAIILAIAALIMGGRDRFLGPILGGLLLGVLRSLAIWFSPKWYDSITFAVLVGFLLFLPRGVLGLSRTAGTK